METATPEPSQTQVPEGEKLSGDDAMYAALARNVVTPYLTRPDSAVYSEAANDWTIIQKDDIVQVSSSVRAENSFDEEITTTFEVQFTNGTDTYLRIDTEESGTRVDLDTP